MERFRWRIVRVDDQLVRVMQYSDPPVEWKDIFVPEPTGSKTRAIPAAGPRKGRSAQIIDLEQFRARRRRRRFG